MENKTVLRPEWLMPSPLPGPPRPAWISQLEWHLRCSVLARLPRHRYPPPRATHPSPRPSSLPPDPGGDLDWILCLLGAARQVKLLERGIRYDVEFLYLPPPIRMHASFLASRCFLNIVRRSMVDRMPCFSPGPQAHNGTSNLLCS
jgi:hypothetical protein